jgi:hypothetical protein
VKSILSLALAGLTLLLWAVIAHRPPQVEILNRSGIAVEEFELRVADRPVVHASLNRGGLDRHSIPVRREGPLTLHLRFADGQQRRFAAGWFSPAQSTLSSIEIVGVDSVRVRGI